MASTAQDPHAPLRGGGDKAKDEDLDEVEFSPFYGVEKGAVLQEARIFNGSNLDPRRCQQVITKLLYLLNQGETFTKKEATEVFFGCTKLFQNKDANLRRMVYLCLKEICPASDEVIIVTSSLMKDMNAKEELYRSNSIKVLRSIIDSQLLQQIERYFKQAIVDKSPVVSSAAMVAGLHLLKVNGECVRRWSSEIQQAMCSPVPMVQFHAVALLMAIKATDRLAISKMLTQLTSTPIQSPLAHCVLIKYVAVVIKDTVAPADAPAGGRPAETRPFYDFLLLSLRNKSEMVVLQAARTIAALKDVSSRELAPAIVCLQLFLTSRKTVMRFAAVRTLNMVSMTNPGAVQSCNLDLEQLMSEPNRSIATYAITTLLKTGSEVSIERLLKQISNFMSDIADDFKIVVIDAIKSLCQKYPAKHRTLMTFLAHTVREEGGYEYKKAIVEAFLSLIREIDGAKEAGLLHLAEFIEDCEFTYLSTQVLHVLGSEGPLTPDPAKYIRYIYNRIILENATVRAAAVSALAAFGARCPSLRDRVLVLLRRTLADNDDEVRDRSTLYIAQLCGEAGGTDDLTSAFDVPLANLEASLTAFLAGPLDADFDLAAVDRVAAATKPTKGSAKAVTAAAAKPAAAEQASESGKQVDAMPQFAGLGPRFKTCAPLVLTEEDTEYVVACVKHVYPAHTVLQFNCTNTFTSQVLENVTMEVDLADLEGMDLCEDLALALPTMPHAQPGCCYAVLERAEGSMPMGDAEVSMKFTIKEIDPSSGDAEEEGYEDDYGLESLAIAASDYMKPMPTANFKVAWDALEADTEVLDDYGLGPSDSVGPTVEQIIAHMGMHCCEGTDMVASNARSHTVMLAGEFCGGGSALVRIAFGLDSAQELVMKVTSRASSLDVSNAVHALIQAA